MLVGRLADDPFVLSPALAGGDPMPPAAVERNLAQAVAALDHERGRGSEPPAGCEGLAGEWASFVGAATAEVGRRRRLATRCLTTSSSATCTGPSPSRAPARLAAQLAERFPLVLVDEFQDTDRLQWEVFDRAFGAGRLIIVGDPKQAIYRFRGADLPAYLEAVRGSEAASLATNFRSDRRLLRAVGALFEGAGSATRRCASRRRAGARRRRVGARRRLVGRPARPRVVTTGHASAAPARDTLKTPPGDA